MSLPKSDFLAQLRSQLGTNQRAVAEKFVLLTAEQLNGSPAKSEWSMLQCIEHLNLTHAYYRTRIEAALRHPVRVSNPSADVYQPSFWGRIYMHFSFNPKYSFPTASEIMLAEILTPQSLNDYRVNLEALQSRLSDVQDIDLRRTQVPINKAVFFNLGDCFKVLVYHDDLHIQQAMRVLQALQLRY